VLLLYIVKAGKSLVDNRGKIWIFRKGQPDHDDDVEFLQGLLQPRSNIALFESHLCWQLHGLCPENHYWAYEL